MGRAGSIDRCQASSESVSVLGVPVRAGAALEIVCVVRSYLRDPWDGVCRHVATVNPEYIIAARDHPSFTASLRQTDLNTVDGIGVLAAVRLRGRRPSRHAERLTGVHLVESLAASSAEDAAPIFLLGAGPGVAAAAVNASRRRWPESRVVDAWGGGTAESEHDAESLRRIAASGARIVFVAYGAIGQVNWIERNRTELAARGVRLAVGVGGTLDMISGTVRRAPEPVRRVGLEWLYRLVLEPWRWRRQLALPRFAALVIWDSVRST